MSALSIPNPHDDPQGPGDARPTARQIVDREGDAAQRLNGKKVLITGGGSGLGLETAKVLSSLGCHLYLPIRDLKASADIEKQIEQSSGGKKGQIDFFAMDLSDLDSIRQFVAQLKTKTDSLNILINNAGVMATPEGTTKQGFETQFGINHLGHFLLFQLVKPLLLSGSTPAFNSRVISLSSSAHRVSPVLFDDYDLKKTGYEKWKAYGQSKTANIYLALEIERRYGAQGLHAWAVHPGGIRTNLARHMEEDEFNKLTSDPSLKKTEKNVEQGAATQVWAATAKELEGQGGKYLEDCRVSKPKGPTDTARTGHSPWCYDSDAAKRLWEESLVMVGIKEESQRRAE